MGRYNLPAGISFCEVDGQLVFLDLGRDRYFRIGASLEQAFRSAVDGAGEVAEDQIERLRANGLITSDVVPETLERAVATEPTASLVERRQRRASVQPILLGEMAIRLLHARHIVRRGGLPGAISALRAGKDRQSAPDRCSLSLVRPYLACRGLLPFAPNCLRDSLALAFYLNRRGAPFQLVFGVKLAPFAAHCWLQDGPLVLNDSLDSVADFKPILVV